MRSNCVCSRGGSFVLLNYVGQIICPIHKIHNRIGQLSDKDSTQVGNGIALIRLHGVAKRDSMIGIVQHGNDGYWPVGGSHFNAHKFLFTKFFQINGLFMKISLLQRKFKRGFLRRDFFCLI
jgi:hypothetical protein